MSVLRPCPRDRTSSVTQRVQERAASQATCFADAMTRNTDRLGVKNTQTHTKTHAVVRQRYIEQWLRRLDGQAGKKAREGPKDGYSFPVLLPALGKGQKPSGARLQRHVHIPNQPYSSLLRERDGWCLRVGIPGKTWREVCRYQRCTAGAKKQHTQLHSIALLKVCTVSANQGEVCSGSAMASCY